MIFTLVFKNSQQQEYCLRYQTYNTATAQRWWQALVTQCSVDNQIVEKDRMYNFPDNTWDEPHIVDELNNCIDIINLDHTLIAHRAYVGMPQDQLNHLHHYFENLRGSISVPGQTWHHASDQVKKALERYNVIIHRAENFYRDNQDTKFYPRMVCRFAEGNRFSLIDEDYPLFTLKRKFGEILINYCEVGKPLVDVFKDDDDVVGEDNIRPLRYYSAAFTSHFHERSENSVNKFLTDMEQWWDKNHNYLGALGFVKGDPMNSIGNIPVAMIIADGQTEDEIITQLCDYNSMDRVEIDQ